MERINEFWYCVAPQDDIPLPDNTKKEQEDTHKELISILDDYKAEKEINPTLSTQEVVKNIILAKPKSISSFRKLIDISDKRLYLDLTYIINFYKGEGRLIETERKSLVKHSTAFFVNYLRRNPNNVTLAGLVSDYFCKKGLADSLEAFCTLTPKQLSSIFCNLIINHETLHRDAKLRGHGVEQAFAKVFKECGVTIFPANKADDPMAEHDPNVDLSTMKIVDKKANNQNCHSFDLVIKSADGKIRVLVQSLVHTSDPGQYGVNKSDETIEIKKEIKKYNSSHKPEEQVYLLGSVDGVGFSENPANTIAKMLNAFDDFFQMHTLFKIPLFLQKIGMIDHVEGIVFDKNYFEDDVIKHFVDTYLTKASVKNLTGKNVDARKTIKAGKATVVFK